MNDPRIRFSDWDEGNVEIQWPDEQPESSVNIEKENQ